MICNRLINLKINESLKGLAIEIMMLHGDLLTNLLSDCSTFNHAFLIPYSTLLLIYIISSLKK